MSFKIETSVSNTFKSIHDLKNMKAIIECYEEIPCNPCEHYCPFDAIKIGPNMNSCPQLLVERCVGCGICVSTCPGVAIMLAMVDEEWATFTIAYEFEPKPKVNEIWSAVNRQGQIIGEAIIKRIVDTTKQDHSSLITVKTEASILTEFSTIARKDHG